MTTTIWVDADACPVAVRDLVVKTCLRRTLPSIFVANKRLPLPDSPLLTFVEVEAGADVADRYISDNARVGDLVITQDILLAGDLIGKGLAVIDPRGETFTPDNIGTVVSTRNLMTHLRETGQYETGSRGYTDKDKRKFADSLDRALVRLRNQAPRSHEPEGGSSL